MSSLLYNYTTSLFLCATYLPSRNLPNNSKGAVLVYTHSPYIVRDVFQVLKYTAGHINYGGRVTDDWDRRCIMNILNDFYRPTVLSEDHVFSESGIYHQMNPDSPHKVQE